MRDAVSGAFLAEKEKKTCVSETKRHLKIAASVAFAANEHLTPRVIRGEAREHGGNDGRRRRGASGRGIRRG